MIHFCLTYTSANRDECAALDEAIRAVCSANVTTQRSIGATGATGGPMGASFSADLAALINAVFPLLRPRDADHGSGGRGDAQRTAQ
jgi:hypothetical protein